MRGGHRAGFGRGPDPVFLRVLCLMGVVGRIVSLVHRQYVHNRLHFLHFHRAGLDSRSENNREGVGRQIGCHLGKLLIPAFDLITVQYLPRSNLIEILLKVRIKIIHFMTQPILY